jgi:hypothetical protein
VKPGGGGGLGRRLVGMLSVGLGGLVPDGRRGGVGVGLFGVIGGDGGAVSVWGGAGARAVVGTVRCDRGEGRR